MTKDDCHFLTHIIKKYSLCLSLSLVDDIDEKHIQWLDESTFFFA